MKITSTMDFGRTIRNKRKKLGYTQAQLSEYTGFSTSFISDLENGKETAELGKALFLLQLLGLDLVINNRGESV
ncbi:helix-turn-helix domain-containing protein [Clostridium sp.]